MFTNLFPPLPYPNYTHPLYQASLLYFNLYCSSFNIDFHPPHPHYLPSRPSPLYPSLILLYRLYQLGSSSSISTDPLASQKKPLQAYLVIMVMTAPDELERRQAVRQTWLDTGSAELLSYFVIGTLSGSSGQGAAVIRRIHRASRFFISGVFSVNDFDVRRNHTRYEKCELDEAR